MVEKTKLNLYQKLIEVRKSCEYLKKDNAGYQFKYVSSSNTLGALRKVMDEQGVLLIPTILDNSVSQKPTKDKQGNESNELLTVLKIRYMWVNADNPEEKIECDWVGQGLDTGEKGVGKALTYAEKYFLLKFFNIATDKDDPDSFQSKNGNGNGSNNENTGNTKQSTSTAKKAEAPKTNGSAVTPASSSKKLVELLTEVDQVDTMEKFNAWVAKNKKVPLLKKDVEALTATLRELKAQLEMEEHTIDMTEE